MKIIFTVLYDKDDRVSCPNRKRFENAIKDTLPMYSKLYLNGTFRKFEISACSMNFYEDQYCETQKN